MPKAHTTEEERRAYNVETSLRWAKNNRDKINARRRAYNATDIGKAAKRRDDAAFIASGGRAKVDAKRALLPLSEARKACRQKWADNNKAYFVAQRSYRRGLDKALTPFEFWVLQEAIELCRLREVVVGGKWHVDHIVPVSKGGHSRPDNIQVVPAIWNRRKSNVHTERFFGAKEEL